MINVLIVDDSAFMRQIFKKNIEKEANMKVVAVARDGKEALKILMDKKDFNIPIIMVSALDHKSNVIDALDLGAFDFLPKPSNKISMDIEEITDDLVKKVEAAYNSNKKRVRTKKSKPVIKKTKQKKIKEYPIVAIGSSSGGPNALKEVLTVFPEDFPGGLVVVQHMPAGFTKTLADRLNKISNIEIKEAQEGDQIKRGKALVAPGNYHLEIIDGKVSLNQKEKKWGVRPCVDYMMETVADYYQSRVIGVILTGMGYDGGLGMRAIKDNGGYCIIQDKESALVYGMPQSAINQNAVHEVAPLSEVSIKVMDTIERKF